MFVSPYFGIDKNTFVALHDLKIVEEIMFELSIKFSYKSTHSLCFFFPRAVEFPVNYANKVIAA